jgi:hypothetical protein
MIKENKKMIKLLVSISLILILLSNNILVEAVIPPPICDYVGLSLTICQTDLACTNRMFLNENFNDTATFTWLLNRVVIAYHIESSIDELICNKTDGQAMWLVMLSSFSFCRHINEYFDGYLQKCVCTTNKVCDHDDPNDMFFHFSTTQLFGWLVLASIFILIIPLFTQLKTLTKLYEDFKDIEKKPL